MATATIVSIVPREIDERLAEITPNRFVIPACKAGDIEILHVPDGFYYKYMLDGKSDRIEASGLSLANDVVRMYSTSQLNYRPDAKPGLFTLDGEWSKEQIKKDHADKIVTARKFQFTWFMSMIKEADDLWAKYHSHKMISDLHRASLEYMNLNRDWKIPSYEDESTKPICPACGSVLLKADAPVCATCKSIINPKKYKEMGLVAVGA